MTQYVNPSTRIGGVEQIVVPERAVPRMDDAPYDDEQYVRINGDWVPVDTPEFVPDTMPPKPPTTLTWNGTVAPAGASVDYTLMWVPPTENADGTPLLDLNYYVVRWRYTSGPWASYVSNDASFFLAGLTPGLDLEWAVLARDTSGNDSTWVTQSITGLTDTVGPPKPSVPILTSSMGNITATWDGLDYAGGTPPADFDHMNFYVSATSGGPWQYVGRVEGTGQVIITGHPVGQQRFVSMVAVDTSSNSSVRSNQASITVVGVAEEDLEPEILEGINESIATAQDTADNAIKSYAPEYALSDSETVPPTTGWSTTSPTRTPGTYVWYRTTVTYGNGATSTTEPALLTGNDGAPGSDGSDGRGITATEITYQVGSSGTTPPTGAWTTTPSATAPGQFLWTRTVITYSGVSTGLPPEHLFSATPTDSASGTYTLGTYFRAEADGLVTHLRYYHMGGCAADNLDHKLGLWSEAGVLLAAVIDTPPLGHVGWREAALPVPFAVPAGQTLVATAGYIGQTYGQNGALTTTATNLTVISGGYAGGGNFPGGITGAHYYSDLVFELASISTSTSYSVAAHGATGPAGSQGIPGPPGTDGQTLYTWLKYADTPTSGMSDSPAGKDYMGLAYNKTTATESSNYADYEWNLTTGPTGAQGVPGPPGSDGQPTYTWIKYGTSAAGAGISDDPTGKAYIGIAYNKTTATESSTPGDYEWSLILGPQGPTGATGSQGIQGPPGPNGQSLYTWIKYADTPTTGMSDFPAGKAYMGIAYNKTASTESSTYTDYEWSLTMGPTGSQGIQGPPGPNGASLYTWLKYADSPISGMSDLPDGKAYMGLAYNKTSATESSSYSDYAWSLTTGPTGAQGVQGPPGANGQPTYTWIKYATSSTGAGISDDPAGKTYIGIAYNKTTPTESSTTTDYEWSLIQGPQGPAGSQGVQGPPGPNGATLYTWIKYADTPTTGMSDSPTGKPYLGIAYNKSSATESSTYTDYEWSLTTGPTGSQGVQGPPGANGQPTYTWIKYGTSAAGAGISDDPTGKTYMGIAYNKSTATESSTPGDYTWSLIQGPTGPTGAQGIQGPIGPNGLPTYTWIKYGTSAAGAGISDDPTGKSYIGIAYNKSTATESTTPGDYEWSLILGPQGPTGAPGSPGIQGPPGPNGATLYTWIKYADSPTTGMSDFPAGKPYMGIAYNKSSATESNTYGDYEWSLVTGPTGAQGIQGPPGTNGQPTYTWIKYATSITGAGISDSSVGMTHMGIAYNKTTTVESNTPGDYEWSLIQGPAGSTGPPGSGGVSITSVTPYFQTVTTGAAAPALPTVSPPPAPWSVTEPAYTPNTELYRTERILYSSGPPQYTAVTKVSSYAAATAAMTSANGRNRVVYSTSDASGTSMNGVAFIDNDTWFKYAAAVPPQPQTVSAQWRFLTGAWISQKVDGANLAYLDAGTITTGYLDVANRIRTGSMHAEKIESASISTDKLALGVLRQNLIPDASFEATDALTLFDPTGGGQGNTAAWRKIASGGWGGDNPTRSLDGTKSRSGRAALLLAVTAAGQSCGTISGTFPVIPGRTYKITLNATSLVSVAKLTVEMAVGATATLDNTTLGAIVADDASHGDPPVTTLSAPAPPALPSIVWTDDPMMYTYEFTPAAGINFAALKIRNQAPATTTSVLVIDDVSVVEKHVGGASELTGAGLRLFDPDGAEVGAFVSNRPTFFSVRDLGATLAQVRQDGSAAFPFIEVASELKIRGTDLIGDNIDDGLIPGRESEFQDSIIESLPLGMVQWGQLTSSSAGTTSTSGVGLFEIAAPIYANRMYKFCTNGVRVISTVAHDACELRILATYGVIGDPDSEPSSPLVASTPVLGRMPISAIDLTNGQSMQLTKLWSPGNAGALGHTFHRNARFLLVLCRVGGTGTVSVNCSAADPMEFWLEDIGPMKPNGGQVNAGGASPPVTQPPKTYIKTWTTTGAKSFMGSGAADSSQGEQDMKQGYSSYDGDSSSMWIFPSMTSTLAGATISKVRVYLYANHWYYSGGGTARLKYHGQSSLTTSRPAYTTLEDSTGWPKPGGRWVDITTTAVKTALQNGSFKGIMVGPAGTTSQTYYGRFDKSDTKIEVTYVK